MDKEVCHGLKKKRRRNEEEEKAKGRRENREKGMRGRIGKEDEK